MCGAVVVACVSKLVSSTTCSHYTGSAYTAHCFKKCVSVCKLVGHLVCLFPVDSVSSLSTSEFPLFSDRITCTVLERKSPFYLSLSPSLSDGCCDAQHCPQLLPGAASQWSLLAQPLAAAADAHQGHQCRESQLPRPEVSPAHKPLAGTTTAGVDGEPH